MHNEGKASPNGSHSGKAGQPHPNKGGDHDHLMGFWQTGGFAVDTSPASVCKNWPCNIERPRQGWSKIDTSARAYKGASPVNEQIASAGSS